MTQTDLFGTKGLRPAQEAVAVEVRVQLAERRRVAAAIGETILAFCSCHSSFRMKELKAYVDKHHSSAPASTDRILRTLRQEGRVNYRVLSRSGSLYEVLPL